MTWGDGCASLLEFHGRNRHHCTGRNPSQHKATLFISWQEQTLHRESVCNGSVTLQVCVRMRRSTCAQDTPTIRSRRHLLARRQQLV
jgi:hypothetical protein